MASYLSRFVGFNSLAVQECVEVVSENKLHQTFLDEARITPLRVALTTMTVTRAIRDLQWTVLVQLTSVEYTSSAQPVPAWPLAL